MSATAPPSGAARGFDRLEVVAPDGLDLPNGPAAVGPLAPVELFDGIACQVAAEGAPCVHPGFARLGSAPSASEDGKVVAFVGDRGRGPAVFVSVDRGGGQRSLQVVAGEQWDRTRRTCATAELGTGPAGTRLCFASVDVDARVAVAYTDAGANGAGESLTVAFVGTPNAPSRDDYRTVAPFTAEAGVWTATLDVPPRGAIGAAVGDGGRCPAAGACAPQYRRAAPRPVVQIGQQVEGQTITGLAVGGKMGSPWQGAATGPLRSGEYGLLVRASVVGNRELTLWASHVEPWTTSYYVQTTDAETLRSLGCALARRPSSSFAEPNTVVLAYGRPRQWKASDGRVVYGASMWRGDSGPYPDTAQIASTARSFVRGYVECTPSDAQDSRLRVVVGTSNHGDQVTRAHGEAWARMVNGLAAWVAQSDLDRRVAVAGGNDMEVFYNTPAVTRAWVAGYQAAGNWTLFNFGDAAGCPASGTRAVPAACANGWTQEDVWYLSWGAPLSRVIPEIYAGNGANAASWQQLVLYSALAHPELPLMRLDGVLSQRQAIDQVCGPKSTDGGCLELDNTPEQAWTQMVRKLEGDARTAQDGARLWSSDIKYCSRSRCEP